jgi:hypothetical protein
VRLLDYTTVAKWWCHYRGTKVLPRSWKTFPKLPRDADVELVQVLEDTEVVQVLVDTEEVQVLEDISKVSPSALMLSKVQVLEDMKTSNDSPNVGHWIETTRNALSFYLSLNHYFNILLYT